MANRPPWPQDLVDAADAADADAKVARHRLGERDRVAWDRSFRAPGPVERWAAPYLTRLGRIAAGGFGG